MVVLSTSTDTRNDVLLNPDEEAKFTSKPVADDCNPELVAKSNPNTLAEVSDKGIDTPVIFH